MPRSPSRRWIVSLWAGGLAWLVGVAPPTSALPTDIPASQFALQSWGRREGLGTDGFNDVAFDGDGTLWLGSDAGLMSFDGMTVERFTTVDTPGLSADAIIALRWDDGGLWIATPKGLCRWRDGAFAAIGPELGLPTNQRVYLSTSGPLVALFPDDSYLWRDGQFVALGVSGVAAAVEPDGSVLVLNDKAVTRWHEGVRTVVPGVKEAELVDVDARGDVWLSLEQRGVARLEGDRAELVAPVTERLRSMLVDRDGALWMGAHETAARRRTPDGKVELVGGIEGCASAFAELDDGSIVVSSCNSGLVRLSDARFRVLDGRSGLPTDPITVYHDRDGTLWIAAASDPTLIAWRGGETRRYPLPAPAMTHLESRAGEHWVGTPEGLFRIAGDAVVPVPLAWADPDPEPPPTQIFALAETDGALWIGSLDRGVVRMRNGKLERVDRINRRSTALALDEAHRTLWIAAMTGMTHVDLDDATPVARAIDTPELRDVYAITLAVDPDGTVWVGTYERGLVRLRDGKSVALTRRNGLPFDTVYAIFEDAQGNFWMSGPTGIVRAPHASFDAVADGRAERIESLRVFGTGDGLPIDEVTGGAMSAARAPDGRMWFPTPAGTVTVDPRIPDRVPDSPRAVITRVVAGATHLPRRGGEVPADDRDLTVQFSAPTLDRAAEVRFRYRLDDIDADWVDAGTRRVAMYNDLPPGPHHFRVEAIAPGAAGFGAAATFDIDIAARFTETVPFKVLVVALAALTLLGLHRLRTAQLRARERMLARLVDVRTSELSAARADLEALNHDLERRIDKAIEDLRASERMAAYGQTVAGVAHEVRQPLLALGTTAYVLGQKLRTQAQVKREVDLIARETKRMNRVMDELLDFARPRTLTLGPTPVEALVTDSINVFHDEHDRDRAVRIDVSPIAPDLVARADGGRVEHVLVNLLANARKHAHGMTHVEVRTSRTGAHIAIDVADDGEGIPPEQRARIFEPFVTTGGTGLGLAIARQIATDHGGSLELVASERGSTFRLTLPAHVPVPVVGEEVAA